MKRRLKTFASSRLRDRDPDGPRARRYIRAIGLPTNARLILASKLASKLPTRPRYRGYPERWSLTNACNRALDIAMATFALALTLPMTASIALLIVLDDPGPILVPAYRVHADGRQFILWRFRTSETHAVAPSAEYSPKSSNQHCGFQREKPLHDEPRFSRVGAVLHRTRLEDLPMLVNIVGGQLPIIGRHTWRQFLSWLDSRDQ
jgi:lipopolysaccharide/colanic/teichoic acid biosynthesis glycosyltransferase